MRRLVGAARRRWHRYAGGLRRWRERRNRVSDAVQRDVEAEIDAHLERVQSDLESAGWTREEAAAEARRRFGDATYYGPVMRRLAAGAARRTEWQSRRRSFAGALASAARAIRRGPGLGAAVVIAFAIGIGVNTTVFTIVDRLLLSYPMHIDEPEQVRRVLVERAAEIGPGAVQRVTGGAVTMGDYQDLVSGSQWSELAAYSEDFSVRTIGQGADAVRVPIKMVTASFWRVLRVQPVIGRAFTDEEDAPGAAPVALISYSLWQQMYGGQRSALGSTLDFGSGPFSIVGVLPRGFTGVDVAPVDLWLPARAAGYQEWGGNALGGRNYYWLSIVGRLRPDARVEIAEAEATAAHRAGRAEHIARGYDPDVRIVATSLIAARGPNRPAEVNVALLLAGVSGLVLIVACVNIANLLLARAVRGRRFTAIRMALGISRFRLAADLVFQGLILALLGGAAALFVAHWGIQLVRIVLMPDVLWPALPSGRTILFVAGLALAAGAIATILPVLDALRQDVADALRASRGGVSLSNTRSRTVLSVIQASLSVVLLVGAGLFVRSLQNARAIDLGFDPGGVLLAIPVASGSGLNAQATNRVFDAAIPALGALPGVSAVAASAELPFGNSSAISLRLPGYDSLPSLPGGGPYIHTVTHDYFEVMDLRIARGRGFNATDREGSPAVAVVNGTMADLLWPGEDAVGKCMYAGDQVTTCTTVIGVVEDAHRQELFERSEAQYYTLIEHGHLGSQPNYLLVGTNADPSDLAAPVRQTVFAIEPRLRFVNVLPMQRLIDPHVRSWTLGATMFSVFGVLALLVAAFGMYSLLAFDVAQRTREIGLRAALGAAPARLLGLIVRRALRLTAIGVALGSVAALILAPLVQGTLYAVSPRDPLVLTATAVTLLTSALLAGAIPAWRALRIDPNMALRAE